MKINKGSLFVLFSTIALLILLAIQVFWILQAAKVKEVLFNEKANMVLSRTIEALGSDKEACMSIGECIDNNDSSEVTSKLAKGDLKKIDSLLHHFMQIYHIQIAYKFNISKQNTFTSLKESSLVKSTYMMPLEEISSKKGVEIKLIFPEKTEFVIAEMGSPFIVSVILIITMIIIFWKTNLSLIKEKKIAAQTTDFINNMSHEFKTPLSNISLAAKMIAKQVLNKNEDKVPYYTNIILDENEKLNQQIDSVLNLNALEREEELIHIQRFDFHQIIQWAIKQMQMQIEHNNTKIELFLNASHVNVMGNKDQLISVICNLIDNAIKYANSNAIITIKTSNKNHQLIITLSDNGNGIPKEFHDKVFEKYFRIPTNDIHNVKGFGLGLAYIKKVVDLHHGEIKLENTTEKGATFIFNLPYV
ncbi:MAG TPA: HAMP domain-containing sensor histidine kinase [Bacteroidia bacterium]|nr:HAMP domain-containing sensor histidine kinase [Bacteroidia bacterium]